MVFLAEDNEVYEGVDDRKKGELGTDESNGQERGGREVALMSLKKVAN